MTLCGVTSHRKTTRASFLVTQNGQTFTAVCPMHLATVCLFLTMGGKSVTVNAVTEE